MAMKVATQNWCLWMKPQRQAAEVMKLRFVHQALVRIPFTIVNCQNQSADFGRFIRAYLELCNSIHVSFILADSSGLDLNSMIHIRSFDAGL